MSELKHDSYRRTYELSSVSKPMFHGTQEILTDAHRNIDSNGKNQQQPKWIDELLYIHRMKYVGKNKELNKCG